MGLSIKSGSENYCAQVINLPAKVPVPGLDNLVQVTYQGNSCLVGKDSLEDMPYLFFPAGTVIDSAFLKHNNLYRHSELNLDKNQTGFFDDSGRVKAIKFKGVISTGFIIPVASLTKIVKTGFLQAGDSFTTIDDYNLCWKYIVPSRTPGAPGSKTPSVRIIDQIVEERFVPEHTDTGHLLRNVHTLNLNDHIVVTYKLHGTSVRIFNAPTHRQLKWYEKVARKLGIKVQEEEYAYLVGSRRVIKSKNFGPLDNKNHYYNQDIWTSVAEEALDTWDLNHGEALYGEIIGTDWQGGPIQKGYTYGLKGPKLYIYRITNINSQGIEVDLSWEQVKQRAAQLGVETVPEFFTGTLGQFIAAFGLESEWELPLEDRLSNIFYNSLLEKPTVLGSGETEEGFVIRKDTYPKALALKIKSRQFLMHESKMQDQEVVDIESEEAVNEAS